MKKVILVCILTFCPLSSYSQFVTIEGTGDNPPENRISLYTNVGLSYTLDIAPLNTLLRINNFPEASNVWCDWNVLGVEGHYKRFAYKMNLLYSFNLNNRDKIQNRNETKLTYGGLNMLLGYDVFSSFHWTIFPLFGFEISGLWLTLTKSIDDTSDIADLIRSPNIVEIHKANSYFKSELGILYTTFGSCSYGLYIGYKYDLEKNNWKFQDIKLGENPPIDMSGWYINVSVHVNISQK